MAAMWHSMCTCNLLFFELGWKAEEVTYECYRKESYLKTYGFFMHPILGEDEWPEYNGQRQPLNPPIIQSQVGRPKKYYRRLQVGEKKPKQPISVGNKLSKHGTIMHCSVCKEEGHNKAGHKAKMAHDVKLKNKKQRIQQRTNVEVQQEEIQEQASNEVSKKSPPKANTRLRKRKETQLEVPLVIKEPTTTTKNVP